MNLTEVVQAKIEEIQTELKALVGFPEHLSYHQRDKLYRIYEILSETN